MFDTVYYIATDIFGTRGIISHIVASSLITVFLAFAVIVVGWTVDYLESLQMRCMRKFFSRKTVIFICNYVTFVGTVIHELSHAFMAWSMGARIHEIKVFETQDNGRLGHVTFSTCGSRFTQRAQLVFISCAPVLFGSLLVYLLLKAVTIGELSTVWRIIGWYYIISIIDHMSMSSADIKNYTRGLLRIAPVVFLFSWVIIYFFVAK